MCVCVFVCMCVHMHVCMHVYMCSFKCFYVEDILLYFIFPYILTLNLQFNRAFLKINYYYYYYYYYYFTHI